MMSENSSFIEYLLFPPNFTLFSSQLECTFPISFFIFGGTPPLLRAYYWFCTQELCLEVLSKRYEVLLTIKKRLCFIFLPTPILFLWWPLYDCSYQFNSTPPFFADVLVKTLNLIVPIICVYYYHSITMIFLANSITYLK